MNASVQLNLNGYSDTKNKCHYTWKQDYIDTLIVLIHSFRLNCICDYGFSLTI
jgi:hypothetical protein